MALVILHFLKGKQPASFNRKCVEMQVIRTLNGRSSQIWPLVVPRHAFFKKVIEVDNSLILMERLLSSDAFEKVDRYLVLFRCLHTTWYLKILCQAFREPLLVALHTSE